ncbi:mucin-5AC [Planococcus citri]|uniref:mucin-5AC n=1 Tax=Planococcus citri TaxID=170843 RepID=UPI0031F93246
MLCIGFLVLTSVLYTANSQQGQNFFFNSDNRQQARFIPSFPANQFSGSQQSFVNYFPQTNAGPFLPFRATDFRLQNGQVNSDSNTLASTNKFQRQQQQQQQQPQQQFSSPSFNTEVAASDPRFDSLISSPGSFTSNGEDYSDANFHDATADIQPQSRFSQTDNRQPIQFRSNQIARFPPVAISEVTRSQDSPNNPNLLQTHSFVNVHHTTRHPEELPLTQNNRWRNSPVPQDDFSNFRPRNVPFQQFTSGKPAVTEATPNEDVFAKFNRFAPKEQTFLVATPESSPTQIFEHEPTPQVIRHDSHFAPQTQTVDKKEVQIKPAKNNRVKTNSNIQPTTYSPPILLDNRIRNTPSTSTQSSTELSNLSKAQILARNNAQGIIRGRNKFSRPPSEVEKTTKPANKLKTTSNLQTRSPSSTTAKAEFRNDENENENENDSENENDNFEVVTMSQDHLFVSEDNFKGFVDSAVIDSTEPPTTEDFQIQEDTTIAPSSTTYASVKKKVLQSSDKSSKEHEERTTERKDADITPSTTEGWIIVASVQTSRSVSGARFIPSSAIKQEQHPLPLDSKSIKEAKTHVDKKHPNDSAPSETSTKASHIVANTTSKTSSTLSTESIIDKLDQVQSELSSGILSAFPSQDKQPLDIPNISTTTSKPSTTSTTTESSDEEPFTRKFIPAAKRTTTKPKTDRNKSLFDTIQFDDLTGLLPDGFKARPGFTPKNPASTTKSSKTAEPSSTSTTTATTTTTTEKTTRKDGKSKSNSLSNLKVKIKFDDVSSFLPPGYKPPAEDTSETEKVEPKKPTESAESTTKATESKTAPTAILNKAKPVDISAFLPPGFKLESTTTTGAPKLESVLGKIQFKETNELLPPNYSSTEVPKSTPKQETSSSGSKVVFPSRPGGNKKPAPPVTPKTAGPAKQSSLLPFQVPNIQKGWPVRSSTEFTGWSTPTPSPISVEKLLQAAKEAAAKEKAEAETSTAPSTTTTSTTTTTTRKPTTPGICSHDCDLAGSIRLVSGVKWVPELLDHNTKEWRSLANEVQHQLEHIFQSSETLSRWYRRITIDAFSEGSVIVDYFVELSDLGRTVNTADMKRLFHETLVQEMVTSETFTLSNNSDYRQLKLGKFVIDPVHTDFTVIQKTITPAVRMAEQDMWIPQWAIAVIVIGLASLLFVLIFGITVVISRHKNSKKHPTALTEEMLNELNKSHMGGFENYGADDLYNMEDVWNEKPFKKRSSYYHDGSMPNIYDSWRSGWNGYYGNNGNSYYNGSIRSGYSRRRSDYDTNF